MTAEEFLQNSLEISHFYNDKYETMCCYSDEMQKAMIQFAKYHVEQALNLASQKFDADCNKFAVLNSYSLENIR